MHIPCISTLELSSSDHHLPKLLYETIDVRCNLATQEQVLELRTHAPCKSSQIIASDSFAALSPQLSQARQVPPINLEAKVEFSVDCRRMMGGRRYGAGVRLTGSTGQGQGKHEWGISFGYW